MPYINKELYADIASSSNVVRGDEYRDLVCAISQVASDMVVKTLGPYGRTTVIDEGTGFTYPSKDGWTCLNKLQFTDPTYNNIFQLLKKISFNSVTTVGDGTTTAMVAANNFLRVMYEKFIPQIEETGSFRQASFIESMEAIYTKLEELLRTNPNVKQIDFDGDFSDIYRIAHIATNGNHQFSQIIQKIYQETHNPNIQVEFDPNASETVYTVQKGYKFNAHVLNPAGYVNDQSGAIIYKDSPRRVVIFDHNVTFQLHEKIIGGLTGICQRDHCEMVIMAPYFDDIVSSWISSQVNACIQNHQIPSVMMIQIPMTTPMHRKTLSDLCVLTNAQVFDEPKVKAFNILLHNQTHEDDQKIDDPMFSLEEFSFGSPEEIIQRCLGRINSLIIDRKEGFLQDYEGIMDKRLYDIIIKEARDDYDDRKRKAVKTIGGTLDKDYMFAQMRYIKLTGSTGVIKVGAISDIQQHTDKDTIDDAVLACKSAFENGYVRGMNLEILSTLRHLIDHEFVQLGVEYEQEIYQMLYECFYMTSLEVIGNKHRNHDIKRVITVHDLDRLFKHEQLNLCSTEILDFCIMQKQAYDYNLRTEMISAPSDWTVVNSTATDIEILRAVVNVLTTIITSNQYISVTKRFDSRTTNERSISQRMHDDYRLATNRMNAYMDALAKNENYDLLQGLIGGVHIMGELDTALEAPEE